MGWDHGRQRRQENTPHVAGNKQDPDGSDAKRFTQTLAEIRVVFSGQSERVSHPQPFGLKRSTRGGRPSTFLSRPPPPLLLQFWRRSAWRSSWQRGLGHTSWGDSVFSGERFSAVGSTCGSLTNRALCVVSLAVGVTDAAYDGLRLRVAPRCF